MTKLCMRSIVATAIKNGDKYALLTSRLHDKITVVIYKPEGSTSIEDQAAKILVNLFYSLF